MYRDLENETETREIPYIIKKCRTALNALTSGMCLCVCVCVSCLYYRERERKREKEREREREIATEEVEEVIPKRG